MRRSLGGRFGGPRPAKVTDRQRSNRVRDMAAKRTRTPMSDEHKAALAEGRNQGRAVRRYLEALDAHKPKRGRKRTPDSMQKRLGSHRRGAAGRGPAQATAAHPGAARPPDRARAANDQGRPHRAGEGVRARRRPTTASARASPTPRGASWASSRRCSRRRESVARADGPGSGRGAGAEERAQEHGAVGRADERVARPLGVGHEPDHVAALVADPGDVVDRAVRVVDVAHHDPVVARGSASVSASQV